MSKNDISRRELFKLGSRVAGAGMLLTLPGLLPGCSSEEAANPNEGGTCSSQIPAETAGPYPAHDDGSVNCLRLGGIERSNIKPSLNSGGGYPGTATAAGVPLTVRLTLQSSPACEALAGYAIYLWHCDRDGKYSMYSAGITTETYLRGVQVTDGNGLVTFETIVPGCYDGRYPHIHFEIYRDLAAAVDNDNVSRTSQFTFSPTMLSAAYDGAGYEASKTNFARASLDSDNVFSDGSTTQIARASGDVNGGYVATLIVGYTPNL